MGKIPYGHISQRELFARLYLNMYKGAEGGYSYKEGFLSNFIPLVTLKGITSENMCERQVIYFSTAHLNRELYLCTVLVKFDGPNNLTRLPCHFGIKGEGMKRQYVATLLHSDMDDLDNERFNEIEIQRGLWLEDLPDVADFLTGGWKDFFEFEYIEKNFQRLGFDNEHYGN